MVGAGSLAFAGGSTANNDREWVVKLDAARGSAQSLTGIIVADNTAIDMPVLNSNEVENRDMMKLRLL